ncbi:MAG: hypothetical protein FJ035_04710 [Chloroflexi bacterium]|nr:hypothetical protein [Chloroflexota bacterium]
MRNGRWSAVLRPWDRLGVRVGAAVLAAVLVTAAIALLRVDHTVSTHAEAQLAAEVERPGRQARAAIEQLAAFSALAAATFASLPDVASALARGDAAAALAAAAAAAAVRDCRAAGGAVGLTLYDARGAVLLRAHAPLDRSQRPAPPSVLRALDARAPTSGVRSDDVLGLSVFAAAPVLDGDGRVMGAVETL